MKILGALLVMFLCSNGVCNKEEAFIPDCVQNRIKQLQQQDKQNPPAQVDEYLYNGQKVYLFSAACCDQYSELYDHNCNRICAPSGGITGSGDGKCQDFLTSAKHVRLVWKDNS